MMRSPIRSPCHTSSSTTRRQCCAAPAGSRVGSSAPSTALLVASSHRSSTCCSGVDSNGPGAGATGPDWSSSRASIGCTAPVVNATSTTDVALDWFVQRTDGVTTIDHSGLTVGYCSDLVVVPDRKVGVVCLTNATNGAALNRAVRRWALERVVGVRETDPVADPSVAVDVERFTGRYLAPFGLLTIAAGARAATRHGTDDRHLDLTARRHRRLEPPPDPPMTLRVHQPKIMS